MKGFVQQLLLYALIEGKHAGRYDLNRISGCSDRSGWRGGPEAEPRRH